MVIPTTSPFALPPGPLWKTDGSWRMTGAHWELQPGGDSNCSCCSRRGFIARADELIPGACYAAVDLAGACFSTPAHKARQKEWLSAGKASNVPSLSTTRYIDSPALCHNLVRKGLHHLPFHRISHWSIVLMTLC